MANLIEIKDIHHQVNPKFSIDLDQLFFQDGPIYALTGESGAGKSMLMKILALIEPLSHGTITVFDQPANSKKEKLALRRRLGYLPQEPYLFKGTVAENIAMGLEFRGQREDEITPRLTRLLSDFSLKEYAEISIERIPASVRQLTAIVRTLAPHPEILMLDEPMLHIDHVQYMHLVDYLKNLNSEHGVTIILSTKSKDVVQRLANISINMRYGKIIRIRTGEHQIKSGDSAGLRGL